MYTDQFVNRHNGSGKQDIEAMLKTVKASTLDDLINEIVPEAIRSKKPLNIAPALSEYQYLNNLKTKAAKNKIFKTYIGLGYYNTIIPAVIQRNILENPGWYTAYTPYQAEIAQGRLEALLNFQTMVMDLTGMEIANASLLDEGTAAAEAMSMLFHNRSREAVKRNANKFFIDQNTFDQTIDVIKTRAFPLEIELVVGHYANTTLDDSFFGALLQYPAKDGSVTNYKTFVETVKKNEIGVVVAADLLSLALLSPPGEWGADVVVGNTQRFGVPMGFGGPHAAYFACREEYKRVIPGRIIGVSVDASGNQALRMALQTREQHIRRDKATSNICTAQALLAIMAGMYAVYHGPHGIKGIAQHIHAHAVAVSKALSAMGFGIVNPLFFDTLCIKMPSGITTAQIQAEALKASINLNYISQDSLSIAFDQTCDIRDTQELIQIFASVVKKQAPKELEISSKHNLIVTSDMARKSPILSHPIFSMYHSESEMMRYIKRLENKDLSLTHSMISLGSCTMKLNAASELYPITWPEFAHLHPFAPKDQTLGYLEIIQQLNDDLCEITGFSAMSFQPNSGAQGEYAGLMVIRAYHHARGDFHRKIALIPSSAHGTNPASAAMCGMSIVVVKCDDKGNIDVNDLREKAEKYKNELSCIMVTYPSTHGVYEESIREITEIVHKNGGQVYMDGANMNAQVGLTSPGIIGADVCHLNLHKTFAIPHGGGGPGAGPIGVAAHLVPFLPGHTLVKTGGEKAIPAVSAAPYGSALILLISYGYIKMLGAKGLTEATKMAMLNANYIKEKLKNSFPTLYSGSNDRCAHEMILDCRDFKRSAQIEVGDIAKRLMDYGFHAPTVSFPVADTIMVEPTESESKAELDRFCDAMTQIRNEINEIADGKADKDDNVLKNAPHTAATVVNTVWNHSYSREQAVYPLAWIKSAKFWPSVSRVDNAYGDRNLICACPPIEDYMPQETALNEN